MNLQSYVSYCVSYVSKKYESCELTYLIIEKFLLVDYSFGIKSTKLESKSIKINSSFSTSKAYF